MQGFFNKSFLKTNQIQDKTKAKPKGITRFKYSKKTKIVLIPYNKITSEFAEVEGEGNKYSEYCKKLLFERNDTLQ